MLLEENVSGFSRRFAARRRRGNRELQPALLPRQPIRFDTIADAELADRLGQIIAHRALGQVQLLGDLDSGHPFASEAQHLSVFTGLTGSDPVGISFPAPLSIDEASDALDAYTS